MLDQSEFKPFTLTDFTTHESETEEIKNTSAGKERSEERDNRTEDELDERITSFKPITFKVEGDSSDLVTEVSSDDLIGKTDAEKIQLSIDFKNSEFFQENSLLTNAEDFAESIRSGAKLYKTQLLTKIEEQASDTERIYQQTIADNQEAEKERKNLLTSTEEKVEEIKSNAYQQGFESGVKKGMQQRYDETEPQVMQISSVLAQLNSLRQVVRFQAEEELVKLALQIAKNIVSEEIKLNKFVIKNIVQVALDETDVQGKIYLFLHPDDFEFLVKSKTDLDRYLNDEQILVLRQDSKMKPGSIYVESDEEIISRSIEGQFEKLEEALTENIENRHTHMYEVDFDAHDFSIETPSDKEDVASESFDLSQKDTDEHLAPPSKSGHSTETIEAVNQGEHMEPLPDKISDIAENPQSNLLHAETEGTELEEMGNEVETI